MKNNDGIKSFNELAAKSDPPLPLERVIEIFDQLADMEDIAFGYADDGCHARAHLMCRKMQGMGLTPQKAWAFEKDNDRLTVGINGRKLRWWFHVAPALPVQMPDGTVQDMVIDPSLFDGPVSLKEWGDIMKAHPEKLQIVPFGVAPDGYGGDYIPGRMHVATTSSDTDEDATKITKTYLGFQKSEPRKVFASQSRQQIVQTQSIQTQGKTWVSIAVPPVDTAPEKKTAAPGWGFELN
jgi:hypothetical protein